MIWVHHQGTSIQQLEVYLVLYINFIHYIAQKFEKCAKNMIKLKKMINFAH